MAYNSMDAMLMGGIVPNELTTEDVKRYLATNTRKKKKIQLDGRKYSAYNWRDVLMRVLDQQDYDQVVRLVTLYLKVASTYAITGGGPRSTEAMGIIRHIIGTNKEIIQRLVLRIIRDMRTLRPSVKKIRQQMFIQEQDPVRALNYMQFIPPIGVFQRRLRALPARYARKLEAYSRDPGLRARAAARALQRARKATRDPNYVPDLGSEPITNEAINAVFEWTPELGERMKWTRGANPNTDPRVLDRLRRARETSQRNLDQLLGQMAGMPAFYGRFMDASQPAAAAAAAAAPQMGASPSPAYVPGTPGSPLSSSPQYGFDGSTAVFYTPQQGRVVIEDVD